MTTDERKIDGDIVNCLFAEVFCASISLIPSVEAATTMQFLTVRYRGHRGKSMAGESDTH